ncbi:copper chaperone PCu(A)C [Ampullimonas aquatilis]|uniref:copper chaperone PCu(A)C n=1 Tax=Ampullimonas aquatilis TaxID=1341549 RepID=UPI003C7892EB
MRNIIKAVLFASAMSFGIAAWAQVEVTDAWVRGTAAGQKATGAFMKLTSPEGGKLVGVSSPVAGIAEIHEMKMEGDIMKMRAIPSVDVPKGKTVEFKPGSYHVMLMDLKKEIKKGEPVPLTLKFETADKKVVEREVNADVRALGEIKP